MTAPFFYGSADDLESVVVGDLLTLGGEEGRHAVTVKRLDVGEPLLIGDGLGTVVHAAVSAVRGKDQLDATVSQVTRTPPTTGQVAVIQALVKGDRMERAIESMTEAGVDHIVLWQATRSIARVTGVAQEKLHAKVTGRARQAAKQARRPWVPTVSEVLTTDQLADVLAGYAVRIALHEDADRSLPEVLAPAADNGFPPTVALIVGPEGGIAPAELAALADLDVQSAVMGSAIMRSSTAGTVALGWVLGALGRWSVEH